MTKLRDLFDLPEHVNPGDFVLKLSDVVDHPHAALKDYAVTDGEKSWIYLFFFRQPT
jgi:hypothetical protein